MLREIGFHNESDKNHGTQRNLIKTVILVCTYWFFYLLVLERMVLLRLQHRHVITPYRTILQFYCGYGFMTLQL